VTTGADGLAKTTVTSTTAGQATVTATAGDSKQTVNVSFTDISYLANNIDLIILNDHAPANGISQIEVSAKVLDIDGNALEGATVRFSSNANLLKNEVITDAQGMATTYLTSSQPGTYTLFAVAGNESMATEVTFDDFVDADLKIDGDYVIMTCHYPLATSPDGNSYRLDDNGVLIRSESNYTKDAVEQVKFDTGSPHLFHLTCTDRNNNTDTVNLTFNK
ncbi:Ig-like domain-containing protein, partial [Enterobacter mori]|uniref:Ig-like domain-containing protein n=1 Tax=Enterobacter mori TaxID=539813 RepID=UPI002ED23635|nr:Ig-like domain-containing protein [Enterobacter mori]